MKIAENNELHVIVLDEFDAIARTRSDGKKSDTATRDSVVNQLLVLMDGVTNMPVPTFILALTNRRELIDEAVLWPGRLEARAAPPIFPAARALGAWRLARLRTPRRLRQPVRIGRRRCARCVPGARGVRGT